ncbi:uncharacterized protein LOC122041539 isoform X2 [Zingiber officinale]|uniref:uncharacterized protein LOC122041539 isoform X2 n=1 Tax=Zingiber officinale TaxID=94328 RepID=UPI001C4A839B|nr:uncharacterized protein LOC122041539 isoform X2 [Zingiber officinale]
MRNPGSDLPSSFFFDLGFPLPPGSVLPETLHTRSILALSAAMNRGFGGPLLCVGDLLRDVADEATVVEYGDGEIDFTSSTLGGGLPPQLPLQPSCDTRQVFENYDQLLQSLEGNDHSWTTLTLKLCTALKTADKLVGSANSNIDSLLEKVASLETIIDRGDSVIAKVKSIQDDKLHKGSVARETNTIG